MSGWPEYCWAHAARDRGWRLVDLNARRGVGSTIARLIRHGHHSRHGEPLGSQSQRASRAGCGHAREAVVRSKYDQHVAVVPAGGIRLGARRPEDDSRWSDVDLDGQRLWYLLVACVIDG